MKTPLAILALMPILAFIALALEPANPANNPLYDAYDGTLRATDGTQLIDGRYDYERGLVHAKDGAWVHVLVRKY